MRETAKERERTQRAAGQLQVVRPRIAPVPQQLVVWVRSSQRLLLRARQVEVVQRQRHGRVSLGAEQRLQASHQRRLAAALRRADAELVRPVRLSLSRKRRHAHAGRRTHHERGRRGAGVPRAVRLELAQKPQVCGQVVVKDARAAARQHFQRGRHTTAQSAHRCCAVSDALSSCSCAASFCERRSQVGLESKISASLSPSARATGPDAI